MRCKDTTFFVKIQAKGQKHLFYSKNNRLCTHSKYAQPVLCIITSHQLFLHIGLVVSLVSSVLHTFREKPEGFTLFFYWFNPIIFLNLLLIYLCQEWGQQTQC